jgi:hypothetical protein
MSQKYTGGFITKSPVAPTTSAASGIWTLDQQQQAQKAGTWPSPPIFIEDLFSCFLYTGNGSTQTITNGIDLSGQGGLVWSKSRSNALSNFLCDTVRGRAFYLYSDATVAQQGPSAADRDITSFNANGYSLGPNANADINTNAATFVSWTFREQPKFFDIVTYTGTGSATTIAHNLGSAPGCIIVKDTANSSNWQVYHRSLGATQYVVLNSTLAAATASNRWNDTAPTSSVFSIGDSSTVNGSGATYIAYLFAHDAGGFPVSGGGSTNGISCGSFTTSGTGQPNATVSLGYEPQWIMYKRSNGTGEWRMQDNMRGLLGSWTGNSRYLVANTSAAEDQNAVISITPTGFLADTGTDAQTYIYIAIRRGPMKTPTVGTSVYNAIARTGTGATANVTGVGFPVDLNWSHIRDAAYPNVMDDRLRGATNTLKPSTSDGEAVSSTVTSFASMDGVQYGTGDRTNASGNTYINWYFRRAPGFFDEVCYTGTEVSGQTFNHNLGAVPEMMIVKSRSGTTDWTVYHSALGASARIYLNATNAANTGTAAPWNSTTPTSSVFSLGNAGATNLSGATFVNYLFATCAGISKVGSYTGTGALLTVACGFTSGARFVLIKRTDSTGGWYMYDSVRGITSGDDPYLFANLDAVEVTNTNYVDTDTTGFKVTAAAPAGLNASGGTYIFLAIA